MTISNQLDATSTCSSDAIGVRTRLAFILNRILPRGKGAIPRLIGRTMHFDGESFIWTRHGAKLIVEPSSLDTYASIVAGGRTWNWNVLAACAAILSGGEVFWDIGANVGFLTTELAHLFLHSSAKAPIEVVAFEPLPALARALRRSVEMNGFDTVIVEERIVADRCGNEQLFLGSHSIHASTSPRESGSRVVEREATTIDSLLDEGGRKPPHLIKIDVEGAEMAVLRGGRKFISSHGPHLLFESDENCVRFGYGRVELLSFLSDLYPYKFYQLAAAGDALHPVESGRTERTAPGDILATSLEWPDIERINARLTQWCAGRRITM